MKQDTYATKSIKPFIERIANAEDESTGKAFDVFRFSKVCGQVGEHMMERDLDRDAESLKKELATRNLDLPQKKATRMIEEAIDAPVENFQLHSSRLGWRPDLKAFVFQDEVIGSGGRAPRLMPPMWLSGKHQLAEGESGSLNEWKEKVAGPCAKSTRLMLTVSAAFAAPLVRIMGLQPFGINIFGESKIGKTTALLAATSVIGIGRESMLTNWNSSAASFGESAKVFNDSILAANEVGLLAGKRSDAYPKIRALIYQFAEGKERARHSASQYASNSAESVWSGIFVSTAEYSFNDYASRSGERERSGGEYARCLDVPAAAPKASTIFDHDPERERGPIKRAAARKLLVDLRLACERHRGRPMKSYIGHLLRHPDLKAQIERHMKAFHKACDTSTLDGALQHAAQYFALIYAGGRLAIAANILPWDGKDLRMAIVQCFEAAVEEVDKYDNALAKAKKRLRKQLASFKFKKRQPPKNVSASLGGCWVKRKDGRREYFVVAAVFRSWFKNYLELSEIVSWLNSRGCLKERDVRPGSANPRGLEWAMVDCAWKDRRPSTFQFSSPFKK